MDMIVEFGSNACKILQTEGNRVIRDERRALRLISHLDEKNRLSHNAIRSVLRILENNQAELKQAKNVRIVGTAALRMAANIDKIKEKIKSQSGTELEVLSQEAEARLTYQGVAASIQPKGRTLLFDLGGGSLELIHGRAGDFSKAISLPLGVAALNKSFRRSDPFASCDYQEMQLYIDRHLNLRSYKNLSLIGSGGSISTMMAVKLGLSKFDAAMIEGKELHRMDVHRQMLMYRSYSTEQITKIKGMDKDRADIILAAAMVVYQILEKTQLHKLQVSNRGLRYGLLA